VISVFDILKYYYCPREFYLLKVLKVPFRAKTKMVYGKVQQEKEEERKLIKNFFGEELKDIQFGVYLEDLDLGLTGIVDALVFLNNGDIVPLEMKYTDFTDLNLQKKKQIYAYAKLIETSFRKSVNYGYILFIKQRRIKKIPVTADDKLFIINDVTKLKKILEEEKIPPYTHSRKCNYCEVKRFCGRPGI